MKGRVPRWCQDPGRQKTLRDTVTQGQGKQGTRHPGSQKRVKKYKGVRSGKQQVKIPGQRDEGKEQKFTKSQVGSTSGARWAVRQEPGRQYVKS